MLERLKARRSGKARRAGPIDPTVFGNELATRTQWEPAAQGGVSIATHRIRQRPPDRVVFTPTLRFQLLSWALIIAGPAPLVIALFTVPFSSLGPGSWLGILLLGGAMVTIGVFGRIFGCHPRIFDRSTGRFWTEAWKPGAMFIPTQRSDHTQLDNIRAIQIIDELCESPEQVFHSYELNLVLRDASRVTVVDHSNLEQIRADAAVLAGFLGGLPVWDATCQEPGGG